jgi:addiction module HigA family antidote
LTGEKGPATGFERRAAAGAGSGRLGFGRHGGNYPRFQSVRQVPKPICRPLTVLRQTKEQRLSFIDKRYSLAATTDATTIHGLPLTCGERQGAYMFSNQMRPVHPGEILREEYLKPLDMSVNALAEALHLTATRINDIVREQRGVTPDTAMRLARYFNTTPEFWLNLQQAYELRAAAEKNWDKIKDEIQPMQ